MSMLDQKQKTIVFCANQAHAARIRDLINQERQDKTVANYCVRVSANDGALGDQYLREFQDNEKTVPTILTTSHKLSTGVDARNVRNIVLLRPIKSMIEFKQIIGRGTRLYEGKDYFTIFDFVKASEKFQDPEWDGEPVEVIKDPDVPRPTPPAPEPKPEPGPEDPDPPRRQRIVIKLADGKERAIQHMTATLFYDASGRPMSANQMIEQLFGVLPAFFKDEDELRKLWANPETRVKLLQQLGEKGYGDTQLSDIQKLISAENSDIFDVLRYIAYARAPITRRERADSARPLIHQSYTDKQQAFLDFVLSHYVDQGVQELDPTKLSALVDLKYRSKSDAMLDLGTAPEIRDLFHQFQPLLYSQM
jgi:type I restriction enzyme R subunit